MGMVLRISWKMGIGEAEKGGKWGSWELNGDNGGGDDVDWTANWKRKERRKERKTEGRIE